MEENKETLTEEKVEVESFICNNCKCEITEVEKIVFEDEIFCQDCFDEMVASCDNCNGDFYNNDLTPMEDGTSLCERCYRRLDCFRCEGCNNQLRSDDYGSDGYCNNCYEEDNEDNDEGLNRKYAKDDSRVEAGYRAFSCEIECYYPDKNGIVIHSFNYRLVLHCVGDRDIIYID